MTRVHCEHERSSIVDSRFHGDMYATDESRAIFCDECRIQRWLDVEATLARAQADVGLIPAEAAEEIGRAARIEHLDLDEVRDGIRRTGHSLVALLGALHDACSGDAGQFVHYGATTQDIQDTAQALEMKDVLAVIGGELSDVISMLAELAGAHRDTLMVGRTHAQPALPTTFGLKVAGWIDELLRQAERLDDTRRRVLVAELFGGVGTMAAFGERGVELLERFAHRLSLRVPSTAWHVARDRVSEYLTTLASLAASLARIADEIRTLSRPEIGEVEEAWRYGKVGSSTMPHKRNPEECEQVIVLARLARANAALGIEGMVQEHERDARGLRLEWVSVADISHHTLAALSLTRTVLGGLKVHPDRMAEQAWSLADAICTEALMLALGRAVGKQSAHALVYDLSQRAQSDGLSLKEVVIDDPDVASHLTRDEIERVFDPTTYLGSAGRMVDDTVAAAQQWLLGPRGGDGDS
jgi:adenylosuccinate lyase